MDDIYYKNCKHFNPAHIKHGSGRKDCSHCSLDRKCPECKSLLGKAHPNILHGGCPVDCKDFKYTPSRMRPI